MSSAAAFMGDEFRRRSGVSHSRVRSCDDVLGYLNCARNRHETQDASWLGVFWFFSALPQQATSRTHQCSHAPRTSSIIDLILISPKLSSQCLVLALRGAFGMSANRLLSGEADLTPVSTAANG
jgi:hypothetical protein